MIPSRPETIERLRNASRVLEARVNRIEKPFDPATFIQQERAQHSADAPDHMPQPRAVRYTLSHYDALVLNQKMPPKLKDAGEVCDAYITAEHDGLADLEVVYFRIGDVPVKWIVNARPKGAPGEIGRWYEP